MEGGDACANRTLQISVMNPEFWSLQEEGTTGVNYMRHSLASVSPQKKGIAEAPGLCEMCLLKAVLLKTQELPIRLRHHYFLSKNDFVKISNLECFYSFFSFPWEFRPATPASSFILKIQALQAASKYSL